MNPLIAPLLRDPVLAQCNHAALSRLLPYLEERHYAPGEVIYRAGDAAAGLYLLCAGAAVLQTADGRPLAQGCTRIGEESVTAVEHYLTDAIACSAATVLYLPRTSVLPLLSAHPGLKTDFMLALTGHLSGPALPTASTLTASNISRSKPTAAPPAPANRVRLAGWLATIVLPVSVLLLGNHVGMDRHSAMFLAIFAATVTMWAFALVDDYIPGLFAVMAILIAGLVPAPVILAGFASDGFMMAMSILGLGTVIVTSGLSYRTMLLLLRRLPNSRFWHNLGLAMTGFFLTPLIPTINGRVSLVTPFSADMIKSLRFMPQGQAATQLVVSAFTGVSLFSAMFLSSKSVNFAVFSLLPVQSQDQYQGFKWLAASAVAALVMLAAYAVCASWLFRSSERPQLATQRIGAQIELLGPMKQREWAALLGIGVFIAGMLTASLHQVQAPWMGLVIFYALLLFGSLNKKELTEKIDWPFLLYLSGLAGMVNAFNYLGLDQQLAASLPGIGATMRDNFSLFVLLLFGLIFIIRLAVPISATIVVLASLFMPLAEINGVNPWVVGFVILMLGEVWFLPYQCSYYLQLQAVNRAHPMYHEKSFLLYNGLMNLARLAAVYASIPYWKASGLL